ncbi:MAG: transporter substrate-binding domain-containing protein [Massiliimalia sp.]
MKFKKILAAVLAASLSMTIMAGCGKSYNTVEDIQKAGVLVMDTNAEFPPFEYVSGNEPVGVDIDIAQAIADKLGVELKVENVKFDAALTAVSTGKADLAIAGITVTEERQKSMDFSDPYTTSVQYIIVPEDSDVAVLEDLAGKKIGVQTGTTGDLICSDQVNGYKDDDGNEVTGCLQDTGASVVQYNSALEAATDMKNGKVDAVVIDKLPAENIAKVNEGFKCFELTYNDGETTDEQYAVAMAKGNTELVELVNEVLKEMQEDGSLEESILNHTGAAAK